MGHLVNPVGFRVGFCRRDWLLPFLGQGDNVRRAFRFLFLQRFFVYLFSKVSFFKYRGLFFSHFLLMETKFKYCLAFYFYCSDLYKRRRLFSFLFALSIFRTSMTKLFGRFRRFRKVRGLKKYLSFFSHYKQWG